MPQACELVAPGVHAPAPVQVPHAPHVHAAVHVRVCVPHIVPHACICVAPGAHTPWQVPVTHAEFAHGCDASTHKPFESQLCGVCPLHCLLPGLHVPEHAPPLQTF